MLGSLVHTTTSDGIQLHGFMSLPEPCDEVWILVHGVNSNFYSSTLLDEIARFFASRGFGILLVNTRGHDILSFNSGPTPMRVGSQIETISSCQQDLDAWFSFLNSQGIHQVSLLGHSLGALKCCLWVIENPKRVKRWIAVSPPRLNTKLLLADPERGSVFQEHLRDAVELCAAGNPDRVMKVRFPLPMWICASTYVDKYGSGDKYDYIALANSIHVPSLWTFGQLEVELGSSNFKNVHRVLSEVISTTIETPSSQNVRVIANADHSYGEARRSLIQCIREWVD